MNPTVRYVELQCCSPSNGCHFIHDTKNDFNQFVPRTRGCDFNCAFFKIILVNNCVVALNLGLFFAISPGVQDLTDKSTLVVRVMALCTNPLPEPMMTKIYDTILSLGYKKWVWCRPLHGIHNIYHFHHVTLSWQTIPQTPDIMSCCLPPVEEGKLRQNIEVNSIWLMMKYSWWWISSQGLLRKKAINIHFNTRETIKEFLTCFCLTEVIHKHCPIHSYATVLPSCSGGWKRKHVFFLNIFVVGHQRRTGSGVREIQTWQQLQATSGMKITEKLR